MPALGFDDNLGLPPGTKGRLDWDLKSFHELGEMIAGFDSGQLQALFLPVGALPYIESEFEIVAQATLGTDRHVHMTSVMVVPQRGSDADQPVAGQRIGHVNRFCTTSFWAPQITLMHETPPGSKIDFVDTNSFPDELHSVVDGRSQAAMVWDQVLEQHQDLSEQTRARFKRDYLPAPIVICRRDLPSNDRTALDVLVGLESSNGGGFFNGTTTPDLDLIGCFRDHMAAVQRHFAS